MFFLLAVEPRADELPASKASAAESAHLGEWRLPSNTEVHLRTTESVGSNTHKRGQHFGIETAEPVIVDGVELIQKGAHGEGEVIHADKAGLGGRAGELIVTARYIRVGDMEIKLKSFAIGVGQDRVNLALGVAAAVGLPGLFIKGKNIVIPSGTDVSAKVATDVLLPPLQSQTAQAVSTAAQSAGSSREYEKDDSSQQ